LLRRGVSPSIAPVGRLAIPDAWIDAMARAVVDERVSARALALVREVGQAMILTKLKAATVALLVLALAATAGGGASRSGYFDASAEPVLASSPQKGEKSKANDTATTEASRELARDDGKSAGMRSIAGGGHAVLFEAPGQDWTLTAVRLYGARYGYPRAPNEDFKITLCDEKFKKLETFRFPYSTFQRGEPKWVRMQVKPTALPARFYLCADFDPTATKGVYVHHDAAGSTPPTSFVGLPDDGEPEPFAKGDWLIRAEIGRAAEAKPGN
jgi:RNA polymerase sigma-70 factor (ECF subfamily)